MSEQSVGDYPWEPEESNSQRLIEKLHDIVIDTFNTAAENESNLLDVDEEDDTLRPTGELMRVLHVTGLEDEDPILIEDPVMEVRYITVEIAIQDNYKDIAALGRDATGDAAKIMLMDPWAELDERVININLRFYDKPGWRFADSYEPDDQCGWEVSFDSVAGWRMAFWKGKTHPDVVSPSGRWTEPNDNDSNLLTAVLEKSFEVVQP